MGPRGRTSTGIGADYNDARGGAASTSTSTNLGTTRNRTEAFLKYRRQVVTTLKPYSDGAPGSKDTNIETARLMASALGVPSDSLVEEGLVPGAEQPRYVDFKEEVRSDMNLIKERMAELKTLHGRATLSKFDDNKEEEVEVEVLTQQITRMFRKCESRLQQVGLDRGPSEEDEKVKKNVQRTLAVELQRLSIQFRRLQKEYLNRLRGKELNNGNAATTSAMDLLDLGDAKKGGEDEFDPGFSGMQSVKVNTMSALIHERDKEVVKIVTSINELAQIMKDLSVLVIDQGTILDRIDYNLESTAATVEQGVKQLQRAERAQRRGVAATCVMVLLAAVVFLIVFIILKTLLSSL